jgi:hypothetical protein
LVIVVPFVPEVLLQKQPSPKATMAALYPTRAALSYTTAWDTILSVDIIPAELGQIAV